jgi:hypothetical protein
MDLIRDLFWNLEQQQAQRSFYRSGRYMYRNQAGGVDGPCYYIMGKTHRAIQVSY